MSATQEQIEARFFEIVDRFISEANSLGERYPKEQVSAALLFAASRYNAFNWVNRSQLLEQSLDEAAVAFRSEYETMFRDNVRNLGKLRANA